MDAIYGVQLKRAQWHRDKRGALAEVWHRDETFVPVQANVVRSWRLTARGMHYHEHQTDLWMLASGVITAHLQDLRGDEPGELVRVELRAGDTLLIPPRVAHGYYVELPMDGAVMCYLVDRPYADGTDEYGYRGDWPKGALLSERDANAPPLADLLG